MDILQVKMVRLGCMLEQQFSRSCLALYVLYLYQRPPSRSPHTLPNQCQKELELWKLELGTRGLETV